MLLNISTPLNIDIYHMYRAQCLQSRRFAQTSLYTYTQPNTPINLVYNPINNNVPNSSTNSTIVHFRIPNTSHRGTNLLSLHPTCPPQRRQLTSKISQITPHSPPKHASSLPSETRRTLTRVVVFAQTPPSTAA